MASSFDRLNRLARSFDRAHEGTLPTDLQPLIELSRELGTTAVPLCLRELQELSPRRSTLARILLLELANDGLQQRVVDELQNQSGASASALLAELSGAGWSRTRSIIQFSNYASDPVELAKSVQRLVHQANEDELLSLVLELQDHDPGAAATLANELLAHVELDLQLRARLSTLALPMIRNRTALADYTIGCHADGHNLIVANPKRAEDEASLSVLLDKRGDLVECRYGNATLDELMEEFGRRGFSFEQSTLKSPKSRVATAVRRMAERGLAPPEDFYLGRHLLDIDNEHLPRRSRGQALDEASASLIAEKRWGEARPVLEHLVRVRPADAGARARLGLCLLELGESEAAESALSRASDKDPENPDFKWNLAAARHRNDRRGACYLALRDFQATADPHDPRRDEARVFLDEFERLAALHHPDTAPLQFAEAEVLVEQAKKLRAKHRTRAAVSCLETAVDMVPTMTSAWTQLGQLYLGKRAFAQAQDCFHRSLSINPGDMAATAGLAAANKGTRPRYRPGKRKS